MKRSGFTLIELLVVISIIALLMGLLIPIIGLLRGRAREAKCVSLIQKVQAACSLYKDANGSYPESADSDPTPDGIIEFRESDAFDVAPFRLSSALSEDGWKKVNEELVRQLQSVDRDHFMDGYVKDPFGDGGPGKYLRYRPASCYPYDTTITGKHVDSSDPYNPDSYQLWSAGQNGKDEAGDGDDLTNWPK
jgi:prepilin-type N-terminal cleavage/methylation domain-containing protein